MLRITHENVIRIGTSGSIHNFDNKIVVFKSPQGSVTRTNRKEVMEFDSFMYAFVERGTATVRINGQEYFLDSKSMCILTPSHASVLCDSSPDLSVTFIFIKQLVDSMSFIPRNARNAEMWVNLYFHPVIILADDEKAVMEECVSYLSSQIDRADSSNKQDFIINAVDRLNLEADYVLKSEKVIHQKETSVINHREEIVKALVVMISQNFKTEHKSQFYADAMCYSIQYLNNLTNELVGKTVSGIIAQFLYNTSRNMLVSTDMTVQEISFELHFPDQATFSKFYKKMSGQSPREARMKSASNH